MSVLPVLAATPPTAATAASETTAPTAPTATGGSFSSQLKGAMGASGAASAMASLNGGGAPSAPPAATALPAPNASPMGAASMPTAAPTAAPADSGSDTGGTPAVGGTAPAGGAARQASPGSYPHLSGDLDSSPELLKRLEALAAKKGMKFHVTSGHRSIAEQQRLWDNRHNNPYPVAPPGKSRHQHGNAADVTIGGRAIQDVISASELRAAGLHPLAGDAVHVELPS